MENGRHAFVHTINEDGKEDNIIAVNNLVECNPLISYMFTKRVDFEKFIFILYSIWQWIDSFGIGYKHIGTPPLYTITNTNWNWALTCTSPSITNFEPVLAHIFNPQIIQE